VGLLITLLVLLAVPLFILIAMYNGLVTARQRVQESSSDVETELQRRHDLIPNLISTVKGYMTHERELLESLARLREQAEQLRPGQPTSAQAQIEGQIGTALSGLRVRAEAYPELKASANFQQLQGELANTEDRIQAALRFFNGNVRELNVKCESFPSSFIASTFGFRRADYFELRTPEAREVPKVAF
jgi:LemA protein